MRPRRKGKKDLPPNLYKDGQKGYVYRNPLTGKRKRLHGDKTEIINAVIAANTALIKQQIVLVNDVPFSELITNFKKEYLPGRRLAKTTLAEHGRRINQYLKAWKNEPVGGFTVFKISAFLDGLPQSTYTKHRGLLIEVFKYAISKGLIDENPAEKTLQRKAEPRKRKRWTKEQFFNMRKSAPEWLKIAMDLAVVTLQRRDDLINIKFDDVKDGYLYVKQHKTGKRLAIKLGDDLKDIITRSRKSKIACPYVIHRHPQHIKAEVRKRKRHWACVEGDYLTKSISKLRDETDVCNGMKKEELPTLHEFRSLGAHLYRESGFEEAYIQALLGHESQAMTQHYLDGHKIEWQSVDAGLKLNRFT